MRCNSCNPNVSKSNKSTTSETIRIEAILFAKRITGVVRKERAYSPNSATTAKRVAPNAVGTFCGTCPNEPTVICHRDGATSARSARHL